MSKFKYFPSFSVAGFGQALRKDLKLKNRFRQINNGSTKII